MRKSLVLALVLRVHQVYIWTRLKAFAQPVDCLVRRRNGDPEDIIESCPITDLTVCEFLLWFDAVPLTERLVS